MLPISELKVNLHNLVRQKSREIAVRRLSGMSTPYRARHKKDLVDKLKRLKVHEIHPTWLARY